MLTTCSVPVLHVQGDDASLGRVCDDHPLHCHAGRGCALLVQMALWRVAVRATDGFASVRVMLLLLYSCIPVLLYPCTPVLMYSCALVVTYRRVPSMCVTPLSVGHCRLRGRAVRRRRLQPAAAA